MHPKIIDTHIHVWDFGKAEYDWLKNDTSILHRSYAIDELNEIRKKAHVSEGVLVQAANNFEDTSWMLKVAAETDWISGVVGWLPLQNPEVTQKKIEESYHNNTYFKGVRHLIHDEPDSQWLLQDAVIESLNILSSYKIPYDLVGIIPAHIETALKVSQKVPGLRMVFDHLNQPPIKTKERFGRWGELLIEASKHPNFFVKISGLGTTCNNPALWNADNIKPYIEFVLENFGSNRCFCGSDWPVSLLACSYDDTWTIYRNTTETLLNEEEQEKVFYTNAKAFYGL
jgi:L-fuconolactonase